jgi:uncharacterized protein
MEPFNNMPFSFQAMAKPLGPLCNLNCTYCYYLEKQKLYPGSSFRMTDELLERFIRQYISVQQSPVISFVWQGGEPTMLGLDFYKKVVELQHKHAGNKIIENSLQTNGTLITEEWGQFLKKHNFLVGISIDGPEHIHNKYRITINNKTSFSKVLEGIDILKHYQVEFNTLTVVHRNNAPHASEIYQFLKNIGSKYLQFIPIVERIKKDTETTGLHLANPTDLDAEVTEWSVLPGQFGNFLITIFNEWVQNDVGNYYIQQFDATLANWVGAPPRICVYSETCGNDLVIEHSGDVYSCDHYVYPEYKLGNIGEQTLFALIQSPKQKKFGENKLNELSQECIDCSYRFACHGECPKHRFTKSIDGTSRLNYLCSDYKIFFEHVHPYMQFMGDELAAKRPPSNVMEWARNFL